MVLSIVCSLGNYFCTELLNKVLAFLFLRYPVLENIGVFYLVSACDFFCYLTSKTILLCLKL